MGAIFPGADPGTHRLGRSGFGLEARCHVAEGRTKLNGFVFEESESVFHGSKWFQGLRSTGIVHRFQGGMSPAASCFYFSERKEKDITTWL